MAVNEKSTTTDKLEGKGMLTVDIESGAFRFEDSKTGQESISFKTIAELFDGYEVSFTITRKSEKDSIE